MNVNQRPRPKSRWWLPCLTLVVGLVGCASYKKQLIFEKTIPLPSGRFAGPVELQLPRRADDSLRDYEIRTELSSACGPQLRISYPDGELASVGSKNVAWQALLAQRADHGENTSDAPEPAPDPAPDPDPAPAPAPIAGAVPYAPGHWQQTTVESWPGQLDFMRWRDYRCNTVKRYRRTYTTAVDETGRLTLWAEVPQEMANASLTVKVYEVIDVEREERVASRDRARERREKRRLESGVKVTVRAESKPLKPRPPMPELRVETPGSPRTEGSRWTPGHWSWRERKKGKWVWVRGHWLQPATTPALKRGSIGGPPIAGCTWQNGRWIWQPGNGKWQWADGHWNAPPNKSETPGTPPVPESPWLPGQWLRTDVSFKWVAGRWGQPRLRTETPTPPPFKGATWQSGSWLQLKGKWIWSPGYYAESTSPPPPRKQENAGVAPVPGAVWLAGFWRWTPARADYRWVAGHWEHPPGAGYEWIPNPPDPTVGHSIGGHWKIIVDVPVRVEVRP